MPTVNDVAILKAEDGFIRPSDCLDGEINLLTYNNGKERYKAYTVSVVSVPHARIRFSHGSILNLGYDSVLIGAINTGWEGCQPQITHDLVYDIQKKFKYQVYRPEWMYRTGNFVQEIDLSEFTDKKTGIFNIATPDIYKFFGWASRSGRLNARGDYVVKTKLESVEEYEELLTKVPVEVISKEAGKYTLKRNWFVDVAIGMGLDYASRFIADDLIFNCTMELAKQFRDGFVDCRKTDPNIKYPDETRYETNFLDEAINDLTFMLHRAGIPTILINGVNSGYRVSEREPNWSNYVQDVTHIDVPTELYKITPVINNGNDALWMNELLFQANK